MYIAIFRTKKWLQKLQLDGFAFYLLSFTVLQCIKLLYHTVQSLKMVVQYKQDGLYKKRH